MSVALIWTDFWRFAAPYNRELMRTALLKKHDEIGADGEPEALLRYKPVSGKQVIQQSVGLDTVFASHSKPASTNVEGSQVDPELRPVSIRNQETRER
jgi:hypothetical protein